MQVCVCTVLVLAVSGFVQVQVELAVVPRQSRGPVRSLREKCGSGRVSERPCGMC